MCILHSKRSWGVHRKRRYGIRRRGRVGCKTRVFGEGLSCDHLDSRNLRIGNLLELVLGGEAFNYRAAAFWASCYSDRPSLMLSRWPAGINSRYLDMRSSPDPIDLNSRMMVSSFRYFVVHMEGKGEKPFVSQKEKVCCPTAQANIKVTRYEACPLLATCSRPALSFITPATATKHRTGVAVNFTAVQTSTN